MSSYPLSFGSRIRELRLKKGLTQGELGKGLVTASMISQIESDKAYPSYAVLAALAVRLDVPLESLLRDVDLGMENTAKYKMALTMMQSGEYKSALPIFEGLLDTQLTGVPEETIRLNLGRCHFAIGHYEQVAKIFTEVAEVAALKVDQHSVIAALIMLGQVAWKQRDFPIALHYTQSALAEYEKLGVENSKIYGEILTQLASVNREIGKVGEAIRYYEEAVSYLSGDLELCKSTYLQLADAYFSKGDFAKADEYATKALAIVDVLADEEAQRECQRQLIMLKRHKVDAQRSIEELLDLVKLYEQREQKEQAGRVYTDIATIYLENDDMEAAWAFAEKAKVLLPQFHESTGRAYRILGVDNGCKIPNING
ncbi:MAG TPA: helix-turn-helix transcriptional regulator [Bacilli bacterium]|nr:helix-turn-helix transcriptional regulator [Bacilli bacterium]